MSDELVWNENKAKKILQKTSHSQIKSQIMPGPEASATNVGRGERSPTSASPRAGAGWWWNCQKKDDNFKSFQNSHNQSRRHQFQS